MLHSRSVLSSVLASVLALTGSAMVSGCFKPSILDGGFVCGPPPVRACPEGFACVNDRCYRSQDGGPRPDVGGDRGADVGRPDVIGDVTSDRVDACTPRVATPGCTAQAGAVCDPVCQTGCCTTQKCSALNTAAGADGGPSTAALGCVANVPLRVFGERCDATNAGTTQRSDNCAPGLVCIEGNSGAFCLRLCRADNDCADVGSRCERRPIESAVGSFEASVCGLPKTACDPTRSTDSGCPEGRVCYLVDIDPTAGDRTVCEIRSGDLKNLSCRYSRECLIGYTCATKGRGTGYCYPVCSHTSTPPNFCPPSTQCQTEGMVFDYCY